MDKCKNCGGELPLDLTQIGGVHMYCEHEYFHEKNQRMIKVRPIHGGVGGWCIVDPKEIEAFPADEYESEEVFMSKGQIEALPEHGGW